MCVELMRIVIKDCHLNFLSNKNVLMEQWKKLDKTAVEALDLTSQATYKVGPQHWPHGENAVREMHIYSVSQPFSVPH